jgi:dihydrolipoamide dehydrogenase
MEYDILFLGGGPAGYEGAIAAAKAGMKAAVVEMDAVGGTCLQRGCVPTKAILHSIKAVRQVREMAKVGVHVDSFRVERGEIAKRKDRVVAKLTRGIETLFKQYGVEMIRGRGRLSAADRVTVEGHGEVAARHVVLAPGSLPAELPFLACDGRVVLSSNDLLRLEAVPESLLVVGAGAVGLELALVYAYLGSKVTVVEVLENILPGSDVETTSVLRNELIKQGLTIHTATAMADPLVGADSVRVTLKQKEKEWSEEFSRVLLAVGRKPNTAGLIADGVGVELDRRGFIKVDANLRTAVPSVFACGDAVGAPLLAHKASHQALAVVEHLRSGSPVHASPMPAAVFTFPELAGVGLSEEEARRQNLAVRIGRFPFAASSRANAVEEKVGLVKVLAGEDGTLLGAHLVGPEAGELMPVLTLAVTRGMKAADLRDLICIHPTLSESLWEAVGQVGGFSIHI